MALTEIAPAKINLALHVTGQREDGYHLLETVVTFSDAGDVVTVDAAPEDSFSMSGRFSQGLSREAGGSDGNLVLRARDALREALAEEGLSAPPVAIHLEKNLPVASGIGGGSADAAATLRALLRHWHAAPAAATLDKLSLKLGADIPMCMVGRPLMASGVGENLALLPGMPSFHGIVANPLQPVSTPQVFQRLTEKNNPSMGALPVLSGTGDWLAWLASLRNDLEPPARQLQSRIAELSGLMQDSGAALVRMSGSGASCFALYEREEQASESLERLTAARPQWFFMQTRTVGIGDMNDART
ncbi:4-(cytidine 5'-diphospho)-2-C-methyl-D-erythritol kinase [Rhizobium sp. C4]|uniref:4-(cytidine 5'-diphospho)-2-C-methyl-D-erythritol kinase n=1 Tax=Rhizobium sp. C4 TaxID=1349800 RepID=UPI001E620AD0|nr:4-(cytidine 5'-diphospho)-2-C-methyl-D-erythritol kinase [Rhizobium sp. C4]MCD2172912.1 4-(cytidine 5'-diphospho)-2-C-methyl-D-erythritol kinase [Rhizobium sp. C4]